MRTFCAIAAMFNAGPNGLSEYMTRRIQRKRQAAEFRALRRALRAAATTRALLQVEVAIDVVPLISDVVEDHDDRALVVADIVECWLRLPPSARAAYNSWSPFPGLRWFAGDYTEEVDRASVVVADDSYSATSIAQAERLCWEGWRRHVRDLRCRRRAAAPPATSWLQRFATPSPPPRCA
jgi:hypothetical protein